MKQENKHIEFSKQLAIVVTVIFIASILFVFWVWYFEDRLGTQILEYIADPFKIVISGYFVKAGIENYQKIKTSNESVYDTSSEVRNIDKGEDP